MTERRTRMSPAAVIATWAIKAYQRLVSPAMGRNCRFQPTCSTYALEAVTVHGFVRGSWLGLRRLARCHPLHDGGYDPIPEKR